MIIDQTNELHDPRAVAASDKKHLETITEDYILEVKVGMSMEISNCRPILF